MIDDQAVRRIAHLARIGADDADVQKFAGELAGILDYVQQLERVDVSGVEPISHITGLENSGREDEGGAALPAIDLDLLEEQAPGHVDGQVRVPRVL